MFPTDLPEDFLPHTSTSTLDDVKSALSAALLEGGYSEVSYFTVPSGFAMVSRIERIGKDGLPLSDGRWASAKTASGSNSLFENLRDLLFVRPGFFRILVFVVSSEPFTLQGPAVEKEKVESWVKEGATALPPAIGDVQYSKHYSTVALVYEFEQPEKDTPAKLLDPGRLSAREHLETAGVWKALNRRQQ